MCDYYNTIKLIMSSNILSYRLELVKTAKEKGISETARIYKTSRNTVRKWLHRYKEEGIKGLKDRSKRPKTSINKLTESQEEEIIMLRIKTR